MSAQPTIDEKPSEDSGPVLEVDSAAHVKTQLLRRIAHDIASPTGVTLTVLEELANDGSPRPALVAMARRSLRRLMRLSEHLTIVAELEGDVLDLERASVDIRMLAKQSLEDALAIDGRKDVVTACDLPSEPILVSADQRLLGTVLREVIGNALRLASSRIDVSLQRRNGHVTLRVDDDGPGFSDDALATLGKRFVRRSSRGLGLSLSLAVEILGAQGGALSVEPSRLPPGRRGAIGAAVLVMLPVSG